jgi:ubiquinone/menaquinone biosynthesis C-methylase UbiE
MVEKKFDPKKLDKLNNPGRLIDIPVSFIWDKINKPETSTLLDIGAGTGLFSCAFAEIAPECTIIALDISEIMIEWMNINIIPAHPNIETMLMEEHRVLLNNEAADVVIMINLHHEIDNPEQMVAECFRLLKKGGKIAICDWRKEDIPKGPPIEIRISSLEVATQLKKVGFTNIQTFDTFKYNWLIVAEKIVNWV